MRINQKLFASTGAVVATVTITAVLIGSAGRAEDPKPEDPRIGIGFAIAPVPLKLTGKDPKLVENDTQKEQAVRKALANHVDIWNRNEMGTPSFGKLYTSDADVVLENGMHLKGRDENMTQTTKVREGVYGKTHLVWNPIRVRFVRPDVAVAVVAGEATFGQDKRNSVTTIVLVHENSQWLISALENPPVFGPEGPCPSNKSTQQ